MERKWPRALVLRATGCVHAAVYAYDTTVRDLYVSVSVWSQMVVIPDLDSRAGVLTEVFPGVHIDENITGSICDYFSVLVA